ncbi:MAG: Histidine kinase [uncultured Sulfurovum sp.]|uniref:histidine kinase n=1 Tax=uncultured Sulfurovum sp. TaxID=269237 RepID=A0A6S6U129_9BACT|nr:MAG: Histidine kinase [uncultured Sulfurovum sp.]
MVGAIAGVLLIVATLLALQLSVYLDKKNEVYRAVMLYDLLFTKHPSKDDFEKYIQKHQLTPVGGSKMKEVEEKGVPFIEDELFRKTLQSGDIGIYVYEMHCYYAYKMDSMYYYRSDEPMTPYKLYIGIIAIFLFVLLLMLFRFISSSINPLQELYVQIQRFANGEKDINIHIEGTDEVAQVANAFDASVKRTQALEKSRALFLRNVMHELKTPISKGKMLMHFIEGEAKDKRLLEDLFDQMQGHLDDFARVESLSEKSLELDLKTYAVIDLVDQAIDMLDIHRDEFEISVGVERVEVDFKLFTYVIKNLLDNAFKYKDAKPVYIGFANNRLSIKNSGTPFKEGISKYMNAYERDLTQHSLEGMGLGLYIVDGIVNRHDYTFAYRFMDGMHCFSIEFRKK